MARHVFSRKSTLLRAVHMSGASIYLQTPCRRFFLVRVAKSTSGQVFGLCRRPLETCSGIADFRGCNEFGSQGSWTVILIFFVCLGWTPPPWICRRHSSMRNKEEPKVVMPGIQNARWLAPHHLIAVLITTRREHSYRCFAQRRVPDLELEHNRRHQPHPPRANPMCFFNNPQVQNPELQFSKLFQTRFRFAKRPD
ncbi:hypothetical protein BKA80DRAFT_42784 [Phyllosticta citrichinensis]